MTGRAMKQTTKFLQSNGLRIAYETFGNPTDPTILLVAGLYNQLVRWPVELCELLVTQGFRVVRFDNRDIGLTDKMDGIRAPSFLRLLLDLMQANTVSTIQTKRYGERRHWFA